MRATFKWQPRWAAGVRLNKVAGIRKLCFATVTFDMLITLVLNINYSTALPTATLTEASTRPKICFVMVH